MPNLFIALTHYPVINKNGDIIASAVTNLDLHDMSRVARTYGIPSFYVVTPLEDQKTLVERIVLHWVKGTGARYNPKRREALELIKIKSDLAEVKNHIQSKSGESPEVVVTSACHEDGNLSFDEFREMLKNDRPYLLVFGTAWGLSDSYMNEADHQLEPIAGADDYNHLSVRSASAIILDRLLGSDR
ncbi:MAG: RNA methyltransferase [Deltaproteobacteria bacterium]|nr:RNA methyltransferase [Deltaproteobacteria bacterium]